MPHGMMGDAACRIGRRRPRHVSGRSAGFTLVELLVVVAIIGVLVGLLLPAVQARAKRGGDMQCANNVKQLSLGCLLHEHSLGYLPTGGWWWQWAGDADRGFDRRQPGGWIYNILPFIEQQALHNMGSGLTGSAKRDANARMNTNPLPLLHCPTRRRAILYVNYYNQYNLTPLATAVHTDYAANSGSVGPNWAGPLQSDPLGGGNPAFVDAPGFAWPSESTMTGVIYTISTVRFKDIQDGASNTYLLGEKNIDPDYWYNGLLACDNDPIYSGYDWDTNRWTFEGPMQDRLGSADCYAFGSSHFAGFNMALCDGSVHFVSYTINPTIHNYLGQRSDGQTLNTGGCIGKPVTVAVCKLLFARNAGDDPLDNSGPAARGGRDVAGRRGLREPHAGASLSRQPRSPSRGPGARTLRSQSRWLPVGRRIKIRFRD